MSNSTLGKEYCFSVEGACNQTVFETWLETFLIPSLKPVYYANYLAAQFSMMPLPTLLIQNYIKPFTLMLSLLFNC
jgi:hypothetical protein